MGKTSFRDARASLNPYRNMISNADYDKDKTKERKLQDYQSVIDGINVDLERWEADAMAELQKLREEFGKIQQLAQSRIDEMGGI